MSTFAEGSQNNCLS